MSIKGVSVFIKRENKLLAVKRGDEDDIFGGMWGLPGGQIEKGESLLQAAKREVKEETGLNLLSLNQGVSLQGELNLPGYPPLLIFVHKGEVAGDKLAPQDKDIEKAGWITARKLLRSLKEKNYPSTEIRKLQKFFKSEKLLK